jgi:hypothetical protein
VTYNLETSGDQMPCGLEVGTGGIFKSQIDEFLVVLDIKG